MSTLSPLDSAAANPQIPPMETSEQILDSLFSQSVHSDRRKGKKKPDLSFMVSRELSRTDLLTLSVPQESKTPPVFQLRSSHHHLAKLIAEGRSNVEAAAIQGMTPGRVSILRDDPTFKELVQHYKKVADTAYVDVHERLARLSADATEVLHERLLDEPETFRIQDLQSTAALALDRTGFGPKSTINQNVKVAVLTDETLNLIKAEAEARRTGAVRSVSEGGGVTLSLPIPSSGEMERAEEAKGEQGERTGLRTQVREVSPETPSQLEFVLLPVDKLL